MAHCLDGERCPQGLLEIFDKSSIALTLADGDETDQPLIAVNDPFCVATGYAPHEVLGRNCRFLQPLGGAGPVRGRMREFCRTGEQASARFVIANVTKSGVPFLNVVYLANLRHSSGRRLIFGSQFAIGITPLREEFYDEALRQDLLSLTRTLDGSEWGMIGSMDVIASSAEIIARHRLGVEEDIGGTR